MTRTYLRIAIGVLVIWMVAASMPAARQANPAEVLRDAMDTETVKGDLPGALAKYRVVADGASPEHAARALLRMAGIYEKLGQRAEARAALERAVSASGAQVEPAREARARLAQLNAGTGAQAENQTVWVVSSGLSATSASADGRYIAHGNAATVSVRDLNSNTDVIVAAGKNGEGHAEATAISRDGRRVAYVWLDYAGERYQLRLASVGATPDPSPRVLIPDINALDAGYLLPFDWAPDGRRLVVGLDRGDQTSDIAFVSTEDGTMSRLLSVDWRGPSRVSFSPDGHYLLFDLPADDKSLQRDVFLIGADGSGTGLEPIVNGASHDVAVGWKPDGGEILFTSDRSGNRALWSVPVARGRASGEPRELRAGVSGEAVSVDASGRVLQAVTVSNVGVYTSPFDPGADTAGQPRQRIDSGYWGLSDGPRWLPDGQSVSYISNRDALGRAKALVIQSTADGQTREVPLHFRYFQQYSWASDGQSVVANTADLRGRRAIVQLRIADGQVTELVRAGVDVGTSSACCSFPQLSRDGRLLYYRNANPETRQYRFIERNLATGAEREVFRAPASSDLSMRHPAVSPDGRFVASVEPPGELWVVTIADGHIRRLVEASAGANFGNFVQWSPDGLSVVVLNTAERAYWSVPLAGGEIRKFPSSGINAPVIHPGGRQIAFVSGQRRTELWRIAHLWSQAQDAR